MNKYISLWLVLLMALFLVCSSINNLAAQDTAYSPEVEERIKQVESNLSGSMQSTQKWTLLERMNYYNVHGVSIAVINNYNIEWARGYGMADLSENRPVTSQTLFQAASISKSINAVGVLKLCQDNKVSLYADINNYLLSWKFPYDSLSNNKKITVANLLSHTAGLSVHGFAGYEKNDSLPTLAQILDGKPPSNNAPVRSEFEPGLKYQYSGGGIAISQMIVMDATLLPYDEFMQENVLNPLAMSASFYTQPPPEDKQLLLATGYSENAEIKGKYHIYPEMSAAGLWTNPSDLCRFIIETQLSDQGKSNKVLSKQFTELMLTPYIDNSSALGVFVTNVGAARYFYHTGANEGFRSMYIASKDDGCGLVVMINSNNFAICNEILCSVANVYKWKGYYQPSSVPISSVLDPGICYPNPARNYISLSNEIHSGVIQVFNSFGMKLFDTEFKSYINIEELPPGVYFLKDGNRIYSFVKE